MAAISPSRTFLPNSVLVPLCVQSSVGRVAKTTTRPAFVPQTHARWFPFRSVP